MLYPLLSYGGVRNMALPMATIIRHSGMTLQPHAEKLAGPEKLWLGEGARGRRPLPPPPNPLPQPLEGGWEGSLRGGRGDWFPRPSPQNNLTFGLPESPYNERTCIVILEITTESGPALMGIVVDTVSEVLNIRAE